MTDTLTVPAEITLEKLAEFRGRVQQFFDGLDVDLGKGAADEIVEILIDVFNAKSEQ
jgi:hypothetical protein